jgi:hypothetical protein
VRENIQLRVSSLRNLIEPSALIRHFQEFPPQDFSPINLGVPAFSTRFDLLTTMEPGPWRNLAAFLFSRWLHPMTCFIGTTVSEYALLPKETPSESFVRELLSSIAPRFPFLIIKDIPADAALVGEDAFAYSQRLVKACSERGFVLLEGQSLAYVPIDFPSVDEFLARRSPARRKNLRRKLKSVSRLDIETIPTGDARFLDPALLAEFYALYLNVYQQSEIHFDLLTASFFRAVLQDSNIGGLVFTYRLDGRLIGYNLCFRENGMLLDKYVGFAYPEARDYSLYAVSWFHNLDYALANGLRCYVAGWTDPEVKRELGAHFTLTRHAVYVRNPILRALLMPFKRLFETGYK